MGLFQSFKEICGKVHFRQKNCDYSFHMFLEIDLYDFSYSHLKWICEKMCQKIFCFKLIFCDIIIFNLNKYKFWLFACNK